MSVPMSAAHVLGEHVVFELECIDRMYCNAYVRKLIYPGLPVVHPFCLLIANSLSFW